ncbi:MAG: hypothetical protein ACR2HJ_05280 [Fimbriimonadales bacterium]
MEWLTGYALYLHDFGHLPFSHLVEEVLRSISWLPGYPQQTLEESVLEKRFDMEYMNDTWDHLGDRMQRSPVDAKNITRNLINGTFGARWLQAIVNSSIDADKLHYIRFDGSWLAKSSFAVRTRLTDHKFLSEFVSNQRVNHSGMLCLDGRSARAAAELWRERIFLYDRFYFSPELRVAERIAFEIILAFMIRAVMSSQFSDRSQLPASMESQIPASSARGIDVVSCKFDAAHLILNKLQDESAGSEDLEYAVLQKMLENLDAHARIDEESSSFLRAGFETLTSLKKGDKTLSNLASEAIVETPILFNRNESRKVREALRPVQHRYCTQVLLDITTIPKVLAAPRKWKRHTNRVVTDNTTLVPAGQAESWGPGSQATVPLTDEAVKSLENPAGRIVVIAPGGKTAKSAYIWNIVWTTLRDSGVDVEWLNNF